MIHLITKYDVTLSYFTFKPGILLVLCVTFFKIIYFYKTINLYNFLGTLMARIHVLLTGL